ncbi:Glycosyl transferase family 8 protein [Coccidioides posadasii C735 delta SOWgp]|uniref:glycogenin glucosyltransferase n=1 Tax=Coccidioides posadasii (strain C735) TaxID=222929 RepID=C5P955_COCP7|nr:Glycosyl transferase family 8 protein [Coccidioides posadasii C735 delta SOWgp]EER26267.1 Glycosyl transferase family 8 protein [Coccidioides posadasii C735 delta SOWgp]|eukprot:XP_003068412.1 Glycosyl transferase family 8 protein [Coccidioides posadasii C735 delta SOWgp]
MVLAHSLRDNGTRAKIVVLVTPDSLQASTIEELKSLYDEVIPVSRVVNVSPANLYLMDRPDLISTFTKIELWRQIQYRQIVYIDADVVALRAPDELLTLDTQLAAVPDIGWPDCFNSGVLVLRPSLQTYYSLVAFAQRGISFDGADQGLLNMHFRNWDRLSFAYNCTPSGHYQYIPAFRHFQSSISLVHYIGQKKPWSLPRQTFPVEGPYNQLLARWWAVYDRHYRPAPPMAIPASIQPDYLSTEHGLSQPASTGITEPFSPPDSGSIASFGSAGLKSATASEVCPSEITTESMRSQEAQNAQIPTFLIPRSAPAPDLTFGPEGGDLCRAGHEIPVAKFEPASNVIPQNMRREQSASIHHPQILPVSKPSAQPVESYASRETPAPSEPALSAVPQHARGEENISVHRPQMPPTDQLSTRSQNGPSQNSNRASFTASDLVQSIVPQYVHGEENILVHRPRISLVDQPSARSQKSHAPSFMIPEPALSVVPQYVYGEENVSVHRPQMPPVDQPSTKLAGSYTDIGILTPRTTVHRPVQLHQTSLPPTEPAPTVDGSGLPRFVSVEAKETANNASTQPLRAVSPPMMIWDAARAPPPLDSRPEAANFPSQTYAMSNSTQLFRPPKSYPKVPKHMYYEVPPKPPVSEALARIFPWESQAPVPSRVFSDEVQDNEAPHPRATLLGKTKGGPLKGTGRVPTNPWDTHNQTNAWDEIPEIEQYMRSFQGSRKGSVQVISGAESSGRRPSLRLTDFPTEAERPSLPVTPALIRRRYLKGSKDGTEGLRGAKGVPQQDEWVCLTVNAFANILRVTYLYWRFTEPRRAAREAS